MIKVSYVKIFLEYCDKFTVYYYIEKVPLINPTPRPFLGVS